MKMTLTSAIFHLLDNELLPKERILLRLWRDEFDLIQKHLRQWEGMTAWISPIAEEAGLAMEVESENSQINALVIQLKRQNLAVVSLNCFPIDDDTDNEGGNDWMVVMHRDQASKILHWLAENVFNGRKGHFDAPPSSTHSRSRAHRKGRLQAA